MTEKHWQEENRELLDRIVEASHRYRNRRDWQSLLMLAKVLSSGARAVFEVFSAEGCVEKTLTVEDILRRR